MQAKDMPEIVKKNNNFKARGQLEYVLENLTMATGSYIVAYNLFPDNIKELEKRGFIVKRSWFKNFLGSYFIEYKITW